MLQPIPAIPATIGRFDFRYGYVANAQRNVFYFRGPAVLNPGWTFAGWWGSVEAWLVNTGLPQVPKDFTELSYWAFYNDGVTTHSNGTINLAPSANPFDCLDPAVCPCFTKRGGILGPNGVGRMYAPAAVRPAIANGEFDPSYLTVYATQAAKMMLAVSYNGQTWFPAHYSPQLGTFSNYSLISVLAKPRYLYRRRPGRDRGSPAYQYPVVP